MQPDQTWRPSRLAVACYCVAAGVVIVAAWLAAMRLLDGWPWPLVAGFLAALVAVLTLKAARLAYPILRWWVQREGSRR